MTIKFIVYAVTVIFTYILGLISKKLKWNENLPIEIQNIIIILISTLIGILIHVENLDANSIFSAVISAVGGVGTAVVVYDAQKMDK